ncbi:MAG: twin-arginine translocase subunit TatB [Caldilineaceae bacterium]|nr:twin-arginine translocase subunit TatB [Caldilineaceae bacterium]
MDSFFGIGLPELVLIAIVALIVLGPERLPGAMREIARFIGKLRDLTAEVQSQFSEELKVLDEMNPRRLLDDATKPAQQKPPAQQRPAAFSHQPAAGRAKKQGSSAQRRRATKQYSAAKTRAGAEHAPCLCTRR